MNLCRALGVMLILLSLGCADFGNQSPSGEKNKDGSKKKLGNNPLPEHLRNPNQGEFSRERMLVNIGINVIVPAVEELKAKTSLLELEVNRLCENLEGARSFDPGLFKDAQKQWREAMLTFHYVNAIPVGPLADDSLVDSSSIYSFPFFNRCGIDQHVLKVSQGKAAPEKLPHHMEGFLALEYLLFEDDLKAGCNRRAFPELDDWEKLPRVTRAQNRCAVAQKRTQLLKKNVNDLHKMWSRDGANYSKTLIDGSEYSSLKEAVNAFTDSMFSIEELKDDKLSLPLGNHKDCFQSTCPERAEHPYAKIALPAAVEQLKGFRDGYFGATSSTVQAFGIDDYLHSQGHRDVAASMKEKLMKAMEAGEKLAATESLRDIISTMNVADCKESNSENRKVEICAWVSDIQKVAFVLKKEIMAALALDAPPVFEGDND